MSRSLPDGGKTYSVSGRYTTSARFPCIGRRCRDRRPGGLRTGGRPDPEAARDDAWRAEIKDHDELFGKLKSRLPAEMTAQRQALEKAL